MLRRATEDETAAFMLIERTLRRTRPVVSDRGLESLNLLEGRIERGSLGRLRFRFSGNDSDYEPENSGKTRPISDEEGSWWDHIHKLVDVARPVTDSQWNLVSMHLGERVLSRLSMGSVVTTNRDGALPFRSSARRSRTEGRVESQVDLLPIRHSEANFLAAIDAFLREDGDHLKPELRVKVAWRPAQATRRLRYHPAISPLTRGRRGAKGNWQKCPLCRAPVVRGRFNPRLLFGITQAGSGVIRDLRGGFMSRLHETYLVEDPDSLLHLPDSHEEAKGAPSNGPIASA